MKWKKQALSLLLTGCMAISMVPATAFAADVPTAIQVVESEMVKEVAEDNNATIEKTPITDIVELAKVLAPNKKTDTYNPETIEVTQGTNTIKLLKDVTVGGTYQDYIRISGSGTNFTLDLNGKKLNLGKVTEKSKVPVARALIVNDGATLTITDTSSEKNGEISGGQATVWAVQAQNGSKVIVNGGKITSTTGGAVGAAGGHAVNKDSVIINGGTLSGKNEVVKVFNNSTLEIHGGTITQTGITDGKSYGTVGISSSETAKAIATIDGSNTVINSTTSDNKGGGVVVFGKSTLNVNGGKISSNDFGIATNGSKSTPNYSGSIINVTGGEITGTGAGMYLPSSGGKTTISGNPTIQGKWGIVVRGGDINIKDNPVVTATGTGSENLPVGALVLDKNSSYGTEGKVTAKVEGGKFKGTKAVVYAENGTQKTGTEAKAIGGFISGGYFSEKPDTAYVSADKVVVDNTGTDKDTYPYTIGQAVLESADVDASTNLSNGESLVSTVVTSDDKKSGTITLVGSINEFDDEKEITLKLDCTNNTDCTVHKDDRGSEKTKKIKLSHLEGNLVAEPQFITVHGIKYAIKLDITEKPTNVEVETVVAAPETDTEAIKDPTAKAAVEANIDSTTAKLTDSKEIMKQVDAVVASLGDKEDVEALLATAGKEDGKTYTTLDVETYVEVKATEYKPDGDDAHLSVDITPYIKLVPETADGKKGEPIGEPTKVNTDEETLVDVTVGVPSALADKIYARNDSGNAHKADIIHTKENGKKYLYTSDALSSKSDTSVKFKTRGFSGYDIYPVSQAAVEVTVNGVTTPYSSLQAAVDSLKDGDEATIKLLEACPDTATTDKKVKITIDAGTFGFSGNILNSKYTDADNASNIYDFKNGSQKPGTQPGGPGTNPGPNPGNPSDGTTGGTTSNHNVTVKTAENGSVTASATSNIAPNTEVTLTVKPADGYVLDTLKATISSGEVALTKVNDTTYTFKMPTADVTITPTFKLASEQKPDEDTVCKPYTDVDSSYAYHDQVHYMIENKLMTGVSANTFGLNVVLNRAMVAQILYSKAEPTKPSYTVTNSFSDVKAGDWFANSVTWAESNGVTDGYGDGTFRPYNQVTREELVTMLYGEADQPDVTGNLSAYTDASSVSDWAVKAMTWAIENGVVTGTTATTLSPKNTTPRYQAAIMFYKYFTK